MSQHKQQKMEGFGERAQWLGAQDALLEDTACLFPALYGSLQLSLTPGPGDSMPSFGSAGTRQMHMVYRHICNQNIQTLMHIK